MWIVKVGILSMLKFHVITHMSSVQIQTDEKERKEQKQQTDTRELSSDLIVQTEDGMTSEAFVKYPCNYCLINMYTEPPFFSRIMPLPSYTPYYF